MECTRIALTALILAAFVPGVSASAHAQEPAQEEPPRLQHETTFPGPFEGTIIHRVFDPATGVVCYLFVPEWVAHHRSGDPIDFGANSLGSISCVGPP